MKQKPSFWAILPARVRYDKRLCPNEKILFAEISAMCNVKGYCYATNRYFSDLYGVSLWQVSRWINNLEKAGHVRLIYDKKDNSSKEQLRKIYLNFNIIDMSSKDNKDNDIDTNNYDNDNQIDILALWEEVYKGAKK